MSRPGSTLHDPVNGMSEETWEGFSWPAFFFSPLWLFARGLPGHSLLALAACAASAGFALPLVGLYYGFTANELHRLGLIRRGYLTRHQYMASYSPRHRSGPSSPAPSGVR